jgi:hypothetical protein
MRFDLTPKNMSGAALGIAIKVKFGPQPVDLGLILLYVEENGKEMV